MQPLATNTFYAQKLSGCAKTFRREILMPSLHISVSDRGKKSENFPESRFCNAHYFRIKICVFLRSMLTEKCIKIICNHKVENLLLATICFFFSFSETSINNSIILILLSREHENTLRKHTCPGYTFFEPLVNSYKCQA